MTSPHFKNVAHTLATACGNAGVTLDIYALLHLTEALIDMGFDATEPEVEPDPHDVLVDMCQRSSYILENVQGTRNIMAIKELRTLVPGTTLKAAKDAVLDSHVQASAALWSNPWADHRDPDEPPF